MSADHHDDSHAAHAARIADRGAIARAAGITEPMIDQLVRTFYGRVRGDAVLGPVFVRALGDGSWEPHLVKLVQFWSSVMLATGSYHGRPVPAHARLPDLEPGMFRLWLDLFGRTAAEIAPPAAARLFCDRAERIADSMRVALATVRGTDWLPAAARPVGRVS